MNNIQFPAGGRVLLFSQSLPKICHFFVSTHYYSLYSFYAFFQRLSTPSLAVTTDLPPIRKKGRF